MLWIAMLEASPPPSVSIPEAKKLRSATVPRGVRGECRLRSIEERLRFLDLEGQEDLAVFHTSPVLDGNERQVA